MKKVMFSFLFLFILLIPMGVFATNEVNIYLFHEEDCSICKQERVYLEALKKRYPNIRLYEYETGDIDSYELMLKAKKMYQTIENGSVPFTIVGDSNYTGFSQNTKALIQRKVYEYSKNSYENRLGKELGITYRSDLDLEVKEYKDNDSYTIEETSGISHTTPKTDPNAKKYESSVYLISIGFLLGVMLFFISVLEKRKPV